MLVRVIIRHALPRFLLLFYRQYLFSFAHSTNAGFRISLTGTALEQRATPQVVKKLKLVGTPTKIYKNSAFITGMLLLLLSFCAYFCLFCIFRSVVRSILTLICTPSLN